MVVTNGLDRFEVKNTSEALDVLRDSFNSTDKTVDEICSLVCLSGISVLDVVRCYSFFSQEKEDANVVRFEKRKDRNIQRQFSREVKYGNCA